MKAPELEDALTNELTINKLSVAFDRIYGLPVAKYEFVEYEEERDDGGVYVQVHLQHETTRVTVRIKGPRINGQFNWGLKIGKQYITEFHREDGSKHYFIEGYLKPAVEETERIHGAQDLQNDGAADEGGDEQAGLHRPVRIR